MTFALNLGLERMAVYILYFFSQPTAVADPGFPRRGGANPKGGANLLFGQFFPENCMKMKKFWARGGVGARPS